jgi:hypothetical protein
MNAKETPFPIEALIMVLLLQNAKMISWLPEQVSKHRNQYEFHLGSIILKGEPQDDSTIHPLL